MIKNIEDEKNIVQLGSGIKELNNIKETSSSFEVGSCLKLSNLSYYFHRYVSCADKNTPAYELGSTFLKVISSVASPQIRNTASVGGSIMWKHPSSDLMTFYLTLSCKIRLCHPNGTISDMVIDDSFHFQKCDEIIKNRCIITMLIIPKLSSSQHVGFYKKGKRKEFSLSIMNIGILVSRETVEKDAVRVYKNVRIVFGGTENPGDVAVQNSPNFAIKTMESIEGKEEVSRCILLGAVRDDLTAHSGYKKLTTYRRGLAISFLEEFFESLHPCSDTTENDKLDCKRTSSQSYQKVNDEQPQYDEVERPIPHVCSAEQGKHILKLIKSLRLTDILLCVYK